MGALTSSSPRPAWQPVRRPAALGHADQHTADQRRVAVEHRLRRLRRRGAAVAQRGLGLRHQLLDRLRRLRTGVGALDLHRAEYVLPRPLHALHRRTHALHRLRHRREECVLHLLEVVDRGLELFLLQRRALVHELLQGLAVGLDGLQQRVVHAREGLGQHRLDVDRAVDVLCRTGGGCRRHGLQHLLDVLHRQFAALQRLQRRVGDGLAQRLALLGGGFRKHLGDGVLVDP